MSCSVFVRNNVQTFPASALNGSFFAKYCLLPYWWFWESIFVRNREQQRRTFSPVHLITVSHGRWTSRASFFPTGSTYPCKHLVLSLHLPVRMVRHREIQTKTIESVCTRPSKLNQGPKRFKCSRITFKKPQEEQDGVRNRGVKTVRWSKYRKRKNVKLSARSQSRL